MTYFDAELARVAEERARLYQAMCDLSYDGSLQGLARLERQHKNLLWQINSLDSIAEDIRRQRDNSQRQFLRQTPKDLPQARREALRRAEAAEAERRRQERAEELWRQQQAAEKRRRQKAEREAREARRILAELAKVLPQPVRRHVEIEDCWAHITADAMASPVEIAPVDTWYESETRAYRVPAVSNRAYGWLRPRVDRWAEGFQRRSAYE